MKVLFLTRKFAPQNYIGAIRPTKFAKYLTLLFNHEVDVICMRDTSDMKDILVEKDVAVLSNIFTLPYCKWTNWIEDKYSKQASAIKQSALVSKTIDVKKTSCSQKIKSLVFSIARNILYLVSIYDSYIYGKRCIRNIKKNGYKYDGFFSTTSLIESYIVGRFLKKKNPGIKWIYDLRDPIRIVNHPYIARKIEKNILEKTIPLVDEVTGVSSACVDEFKAGGHKSATILPNGFDYDDISGNEKSAVEKKSDGIFKLVYTGTLYDGKRDVTPLLLLLLELSKEGKIDLSKVELHYAGRDAGVLRKHISHENIKISLIDHGFISRADSISLQRNSDILLLLSWNNDGETGVVTGKFYEYLMNGKPICCIVKGNQANSALRELIEESDAGVCYEEADPKTYEKLKKFIIEHYRLAISNVETEADNRPNIQKFNYKNLALRLNSLLCNN